MTAKNDLVKIVAGLVVVATVFTAVIVLDARRHDALMAEWADPGPQPADQVIAPIERLFMNGDSYTLWVRESDGTIKQQYVSGHDVAMLDDLQPEQPMRVEVTTYLHISKDYDYKYDVKSWHTRLRFHIHNPREIGAGTWSETRNKRTESGPIHAIE